MKKYTSLSALLIFIILMTVNGCDRNLVDEGSYAPVSVPSAEIRYNNVSVLDKSISRKLSINQTSSKRTATGTLEAWAVIVNRTDYPQQIQARIQFFDAQKVPIEGPSSWKRLYLDPNATVVYKESSMHTDDVAYYFIEIREAL